MGLEPLYKVQLQWLCFAYIFVDWALHEIPLKKSSDNKIGYEENCTPRYYLATEWGQVLESGQGREGRGSMQRGSEGQWLSKQTMYAPHSGGTQPAFKNQALHLPSFEILGKGLLSLSFLTFKTGITLVPAS